MLCCGIRLTFKLAFVTVNLKLYYLLKDEHPTTFNSACRNSLAPTSLPTVAVVSVGTSSAIAIASGAVYGFT